MRLAKARDRDAELDVMLGRLFKAGSCYSCPHVVRIVGWTQTRILVEDVPVIRNNGRDGGSAHIDNDWLAEHVITSPVHEAKRTYLSVISGCSDPDDLSPGPRLPVTYLAFNHTHYFETTADAGYSWCDY